MIQYVIFDGDGRILQTGSCPEEMLDLQAGPGREVMEGGAGVTSYSHYVANGEIVERPGMGISVSKITLVADGSDEVAITGVPAGAQLSIDGPVVADAIADGEPISITSVHAGIYVIQATKFPYRDERININATEPA